MASLQIISRISVALSLAFLVGLQLQANAQNTRQDYLSPQTAARARVGVAPMIWDAKVATYAQVYANKRASDCNLVHSGGPYGENIFAGFGKEWTAGDAVAAWLGEKQWYNYKANSCAPGKVCGHYTQVVWKKSVKVGCARVKCRNGGVFITCNYDLPGNWIGQRPY